MTTKITVEARESAPVEKVWLAYATPDDIKPWNSASGDWRTPSAAVNLRGGGAFCWRMEAKGGSAGFDFAGTCTRIEKDRLIKYSFGDRDARVELHLGSDGVLVKVTFDSESTYSIAQQRQGWQAILDRFARHVATAA